MCDTCLHNFMYMCVYECVSACDVCVHVGENACVYICMCVHACVCSCVLYMNVTDDSKRNNEIICDV